MSPRSYLFVPADRPERIGKALSSGADAVIVDLEDAVAPQDKALARDRLAGWLQGASAAPVPVLVRINARSSVDFGDDLRVCAHPAVRGVVLPKAETADDVAAVIASLPGQAVLPLIETAAGYEAVRDVARAPGVGRLLFGSIDFQVDLGIEAGHGAAGDDEGGAGDEVAGGDALLFFRSGLVLASRLAGLAAPVDGVSTALDDGVALARATARARRLGFGAKLCIHPKQVEAVNRGFSPSDAELDWARRVLAAAAGSGGAAVAVDGRMVDAPVLLRARRLMDRASVDRANLNRASAPGSSSC
ncbi:HpcH/HpaI aldolase/citrate lyase family protein [Leptothrix sp. BB-4]